MFTVLKLMLVIAVGLSLYLSGLAWRALHRDSSLSSGQKAAQAVLAVVIPFVGALVILRLCELANPGAVGASEIPWPFRAIVFDRPVRSNADGETYEDFKRRHWNL